MSTTPINKASPSVGRTLKRPVTVNSQSTFLRHDSSSSGVTQQFASGKSKPSNLSG